MAIEPSHRTAALAGAWSVLGFIPFDTWLENNKTISVLRNDLLWLLMAVVFLFVPVYYLVLGQNLRPFKRWWFLDPEERARYAVVGKRGFVWFLSASTTGMVIGTVWWLLSYLSSK